MMKTATISRPCSFNFMYGARAIIESLTGLHFVMPGDMRVPATHPPQAVRGNNQDIQNALGPQTVDPRLDNAGRQVMDILRSYARNHAANSIRNAIHRGALLYPDAPRGPPVAGLSNIFHIQNPPAPTVQPHPGGMGYHEGPPPVTGQPLNTGRTRAEEIDMRHPQQPGSYAGLPLTSTHPNITTGFTAINAGATGSSVGASPDTGTAARAGWEGRRRRAAGDRDLSAERADSTTPRVGVSRRCRTTPLTDYNALAAPGSSAGAGVSADNPADGTGAAQTQQALAVTSTTGRRPLAQGLHRVRENIMAKNSSNVTNSARGAVTGPDPANTAVSASNVPVAASSSATLASRGDVEPADPGSGSKGRSANTSAIAEGANHGASAGEDAANVMKVDDQDSNSAGVPDAAHGTDSASDPDGENSSAAVPVNVVNNTAESGSDSGHSPPHKKQKVD